MSDETKESKEEVAAAVPGEKAQAVDVKPKREHRQRRGGAGKKSGERKNASVNPDLEEKVVSISRVAKVVKGGRRFSFSALIVVGDRKGNVGFGLGKAKEVPEAIRKATQVAQKNMRNVPLDGGTIPHEILGEFDAGKILFKPAAEGTGVKAAGACRTILELAGVRNVLTKSLRGNNPHNVVKATFHALGKLRSTAEIAKVRGVEPKGLRIK